MIDATTGISGRMVIWEELRTWHSVAFVFYRFAVCFGYGLVFDRPDNTLEEC
jgi:hypothetical protein